MKRGYLELVVGVFVLVGLACLAYLAVHLGKMEVWGSSYRLSATFDNIGGLKVGASVEVAGVTVGRVESIQLTTGDRATVVMGLERGLKIHEDAIASIRTKGIIGEKYIAISPGSSEKLIASGGKIHDTESAVNWEQLINTYIHGKI